MLVGGVAVSPSPWRGVAGAVLGWKIAGTPKTFGISTTASSAAAGLSGGLPCGHWRINGLLNLPQEICMSVDALRGFPCTLPSRSAEAAVPRGRESWKRWNQHFPRRTSTVSTGQMLNKCSSIAPCGLGNLPLISSPRPGTPRCRPPS